MTGGPPRVSIVIPAHGEAEVIGDVVCRALAVLPGAEIIVVDDGSKDQTAQRAADAGALVLKNPYNIGNGASVRRGIRASSGDVVVMMDGDGQHPPEAIPALLAPMGEYDMVVAARTRKSETSRLRNVGNRMLIWVAQWLSARTIPDLTSGFRAVKREPLLEYLHLFPSRYSYPTTITLAMMLAGRFVHYVPVDGISRRRSGSSDLSPIADFLRFLAIMFRVIMLFNPRRIVIPLSAILFIASLGVSVYQVLWTGGVQSAGLALFLSSMFIACFGLLADQVALLRRERRD
jgi:glycosyltransferase involved in cell wall biosynthesis